MSLLAWRLAKREDRPSLEAFCCTQPRRKHRRPWGGWDESHPAEHELAVQAAIRKRLAPVGDHNRTVLLGHDTQGLAAVSTYRTFNTATFQIDILAVELRCRDRGGGWAIEALATTLDYISADAVADGYDGAVVTASIHEANRPSQRLFESQRFEQTDVLPDGYQVWTAEFPVTGVRHE